jgi:hypothetical protein
VAADQEDAELLDTRGLVFARDSDRGRGPRGDLVVLIADGHTDRCAHEALIGAAIADQRIDAPEAAVHRRRIRYDASDRPIEHGASWLPLDLAARTPRLYDLAPINEGTLAYVQKATGRTITSTCEDIYAREADDLDIRHGIAAPGRPVLVIEFIAYDADQRPLTFETAVFPERIRVVSGTPPN